MNNDVNKSKEIDSVIANATHDLFDVINGLKGLYDIELKRLTTQKDSLISKDYNKICQISSTYMNAIDALMTIRSQWMHSNPSVETINRMRLASRALTEIVSKNPITRTVLEKYGLDVKFVESEVNNVPHRQSNFTRLF